MHAAQSLSFPESLDPAWSVAIIAAPYYKEETDSLVQGAKEVLMQAGLREENIPVYTAPGSFELPLIGKAVAAAGVVDAMIGFGIIVQGDTHHARLLAESVTNAMMGIQMEFTLPFAYEVLYVDTLEQARARAFGEGNKGREAAYAVLHALAELKKIRG